METIPLVIMAILINALILTAQAGAESTATEEQINSLTRTFFTGSDSYDAKTEALKRTQQEGNLVQSTIATAASFFEGIVKIGEFVLWLFFLLFNAMITTPTNALLEGEPFEKAIGLMIALPLWAINGTLALRALDKVMKRHG